MSCYICGKENYSVEHAPAKSFFPKGMREDLITVYSCKEHNEDTSKDDEYVRNIITMYIDNNNTSFEHFENKTLKSLSNSHALHKKTIKNKQTVTLNGVETAALDIDRERFDTVMRKIAYAIFHHEYNKRWCRKLLVATDHLKTDDMKNDKIGSLVEEMKRIPVSFYKGQNPKVFQYAFLQGAKDDFEEHCLKMKFYQGFEVIIFPHHEHTEPQLNT
ncbi:hypothetical protein PF327_10275 [Sulfurovum sp. XTW-4]|uniref:HNH endonuclease n=1 Tax=Sulfurovum xiamenensis TaxID=3019066 RepID=A0ABT7QU33_9BACT|nr:hypothetical protein [Sulfurovum xiamenensis]MDM5264579.1 hypothetical protein [Sulfurovum xiamenensis]